MAEIQLVVGQASETVEELGKLGEKIVEFESAKIEKLEKDPLYLAFMRNPLFERIARAHIDGAVALFRAVLFSKPASGGTELPWHQDGGRFWGVDRDPTLQIWTALDDCPVDGTRHRNSTPV